MGRRLTYDEYDVVLEGTLEIEVDGRIIKGDVGDINLYPQGESYPFSDSESRQICIHGISCTIGSKNVNKPAILLSKWQLLIFAGQQTRDETDKHSIGFLLLGKNLTISWERAILQLTTE